MAILWVRLPLWSLRIDKPAMPDDPVVQRLRHLADIQESAGSIPAGITFDNWSVSVWAGTARRVVRRCGSRPTDVLSVGARDRVQFPDGPLEFWDAGLTGRHLACTQVIGVRFPGAPLNTNGLMVQRKDAALAWRQSGFDSR